jgi:predicted nucleic acid-binding protein
MTAVVFDSSFLVAATDTKVLDQGSDEEAKFRQLLRELDKQRTQIIVPTPVLAEVLVKRSADRVRLIQSLQRSPRITLPAAAAVAGS